MRSVSTKGFTLVEMSMVLVIVALVVGSIVVGRSMIRAGQVRAAIGEYDQYVKAIKEFQDKYLALPGDMTNATSFWGTDPAGCPDATYTSTSSTTTCNGDGSGTIGSSTTAAVLSNSTEWWRAWQQLSDAGLIQGSFTGVQGSGGAQEAAIGVNVPASQLSGAGWTLNYYLLTSNGALWGDQYGHLLNLGAYKSTDYTKNQILTPAEALDIDQKIDDGKPGRGKVRAWRTSVLANCTTSDTTQDAQAYATGSSLACALVFVLGF